LKFRRQHPIGRYIADFYCPEKKLVIELEGRVHELPNQREYDKARKEAIEVLGLNILYFSNEDIFNTLEEVLAMITSPPESPSPLVERGTSRARG
jgi:very-short-patch-repair endonuclease